MYINNLQLLLAKEFALKTFEFGQGGVIGRDHRRTAKNYQDGHCVVQENGIMVAIVTDGCGSGEKSEVGATLGARLLGNYLANELSQVHDVSNIRWKRVFQQLSTTLHGVARELDDSLSKAVMDYFLFSIVGVVIAGDQALFFSVGDGVIVINGEVTVLEPLEGNRPQYWAYELLEGNLEDDQQLSELPVKVAQLSIDELSNFLIGCDGLGDLIRAEDTLLPGLNETVGALSRFWEDSRCFTNGSYVARRLGLIARDWPRRDPQPGLLPDDTTLIVGRVIAEEVVESGA